MTAGPSTGSFPAASASEGGLAAALRRLSPAEGWLTVLLHAVVLAAAATTVSRVPLSPPLRDLLPLTLGGLLTGLLLAKLRAPDLLAHLLAFSSGVVVSLALAVERLDAIGSRRERAAFLAAEIADWYRRALSSRPIDDPQLFAVILGITVWLVAYTSAWVLYRRGWLATAVLLPGAIATVNLGYVPGAGSSALLVIVVAACVLAARHFLFQREQLWDRSGLAHPKRLPWHFVVAGVNLAVVAALIGWTLPFSARDDLFDAAWERIQAPVDAVNQGWQELLTRLGANTDAGGSYAAFGEQFRLGGALNLSNDPVMLLQTPVDRRTYLVGHRYDFYNGQGWRSDVEATFQSPQSGGQSPTSPPLMGFARGQAINLTPAVTEQDRSQVTGAVTVVRPKGNLLFTVDTYLTADRKTNVQLSWQQIEDQPYPLASGDARGVPVDLQQMARLLLQARFPAGDGSVTSATPIDPALAAQIEAERTNLSGRFLSVSWSVGRNGRVDTLYATGKLPVYDDVEAVFGADPVAQGQTYGIVGLASTASPDALRAAPTADDPEWVKARYRQLPDTITQRTRDLADQLAAGQRSRFDVAERVQTFVRQQIAYNEKIDPPPAGQDVVDYVLFDSKQGYCEYYASAMAVLLRLEGIPARVAGGYYPVPYDAQDGGYLYREKNAHLWVEVFFPGFGWIPFEPTASQAPIAYGQNVPSTDAAPAPTPVAEPTPEPTPEATPAPATTAPPPAEPAQPSLLDDPRQALGWAGIAVAALLAIAAIGISLVWNLGFRGLSPAGGVYARAVRAGRLAGIPTSPALTPREYADRVGRAIPSAQSPARVVADLYTEERYGPRRPTPDRLQQARSAWTQLRQAFVRGRLRRRR